MGFKSILTVFMHEFSHFYLVSGGGQKTAKFLWISLWNFGHPDTSFAMNTDRHPDSNSTKFQTEILTENDFSVRSKLANNLKNHTSIHTGVQTSFAQEGQLATHSVALSAHSQGAFLLSSLCITGFPSQYENLLGKNMQSDLMDIWLHPPAPLLCNLVWIWVKFTKQSMFK